MLVNLSSQHDWFVAEIYVHLCMKTSRRGELWHLIVYENEGIFLFKRVAKLNVMKIKNSLHFFYTFQHATFLEFISEKMSIGRISLAVIYVDGNC